MLQRNYLTNFLITPMLFSTWLYAAPALININTATVQELDENLPGIGPSKAEVIVSYRDKHGPFKSLEDLDEVPGVGPKTLKDISEFVQFGETATSEQEVPKSSDNSIVNNNCPSKADCKTN